MSVSGTSPVEPTAPAWGGRPVTFVCALTRSAVLELSTAPFLPMRTRPKLGAKEGAGNTLLTVVAPLLSPGTGTVGPSPLGPRSVMA